MKSGFEKIRWARQGQVQGSIRLSPRVRTSAAGRQGFRLRYSFGATSRRGRMVACEGKVQGSKFKVQCCKTRVEFRALPSNAVGKLMFQSSVKPNQGESNQIKPAQTISSAKAGVEGVLTRDVAETLKMGHFGATILDH